MCDWGDTVQLVLPEGHPTERERVRMIDRCIAPIVSALNAAGAWTTASCCGHGRRPGTIILVDGRELHLFPDFETGRRVDAVFPFPINDRRDYGEDRRVSTRATGILKAWGGDRRKAERRRWDLFTAPHHQRPKAGVLPCVSP